MGPTLAPSQGGGHARFRLRGLYRFDRSRAYALKVISRYATEPRGLFSTRAPRRPNPIGLTVVELVEVVDNRLRVRAVDMLDGTPLLDIKPYVEQFDSKTLTRSPAMRLDSGGTPCVNANPHER